MKVEKIIETVKDCKVVVDEVNNMISMLEKRYKENLDDFDVKRYNDLMECNHGNFKLPYLFEVNKEAELLQDIIEDVCHVRLCDILSSDEWEEEDEIGIDEDTQLTVYIASQVVSNKLLDNAHYTDFGVRFYPNEDDIDNLTIKAKLRDYFEYDLLHNADCDLIDLDDYCDEYGNSTEFSIDDAEYLYERNSGNRKNLYLDWKYDKENKTLERIYD